MRTPCDRCPWRIENHARRTSWHFYTQANLRRLWRQIRGGGGMQSCHPTDPSHPDHIAAGAKLGSTPQECPGSVILVLRECRTMAIYSVDGQTIDEQAVKGYLARHKDGLTKRGIWYWVVERQVFKGVPFFGGLPLPEVDIDEPGIGR